MSPFPDTLTGGVVLQSVRPEDEAFLFQVYASTRAEELAQVSWSEEQREAFLRQQFVAQDKHYRANYPGAEFQIIQADGEAAGRLYVHRRENEIRIMDIALLPDYQRRGIGTMLLEKILAEGADSGKKVSIHVEAFNPALHWYERLGFKKVAIHGVYHLMEWSANSPNFAPGLPTGSAHHSTNADILRS